MAFDITNFQPIGGQGHRGKAPQIFSYKTLDAVTTIDGNGYFNTGNGTTNPYKGAYNMLEVGDFIMAVVFATSVDTGTVSDAGIFVVTTKSNGQVNVSNAIDLFVTNSD